MNDEMMRIMKECVEVGIDEDCCVGIKDFRFFVETVYGLNYETINMNDKMIFNEMCVVFENCYNDEVVYDYEKMLISLKK